jgi:CheY-like chemotaxis protein
MRRVLIVDDESEVRTLLANALADVGYEAFGASGTEAALERCRGGRPDLVILDLEKADRDDWALLARLRDEGDPPPVVTIGRLDEFDAFARAVQEGVLAFIPKPLDVGHLVATCTRAIRQVEQKPAPLHEERRREPRRPLMVGVQLRSQTEAPMALGSLLDLSSGGAQVVLMVRFAIGAEIQGAVDLPESKRTLRFHAQVCWSKPTEEGFAHGLRFTGLSEDVQEQLRLLLGHD